jgi:hypothetical protein
MHSTLRLSALSLVAVVALAACAGGGAAGQPSVVAAPSAPAATPVATPNHTPLPIPPTASPDPVTDQLLIHLETATRHDVSIEILDDGHHVVAARSGHPGDGASVPFGTVEARNLDPRTVQFTWSDTPGDATLGLYVSERADVVLVIRPERQGGDAIAFDRVLAVEFDRPVDGASLQLGILEGLDTAG